MVGVLWMSSKEIALYITAWIDRLADLGKRESNEEVSACGFCMKPVSSSLLRAAMFVLTVRTNI